MLILIWDYTHKIKLYITCLLIYGSNSISLFCLIIIFLFNIFVILRRICQNTCFIIFWMRIRLKRCFIYLFLKLLMFFLELFLIWIILNILFLNILNSWWLFPLLLIQCLFIVCVILLKFFRLLSWSSSLFLYLIRIFSLLLSFVIII